MEFFEEAINKAKGVFDVAYKKTGEVISVQRQKIDVASMNSKLAKEYEALGRMVIDSVDGEVEISPTAVSKAREIRIKEAEIEAAKQEVLKAQGKKFCENCGAANVSDAHFCYACGESFIKTDGEKSEN